MIAIYAKSQSMCKYKRIDKSMDRKTDGRMNEMKKAE